MSTHPVFRRQPVARLSPERARAQGFLPFDELRKKQQENIMDCCTNYSPSEAPYEDWWWRYTEPEGWVPIIPEEPR